MGAKTIKVRNSNLIDAILDKGIKKWKLYVCKFINVPVLHKYRFMYNISYYAGKIEKEDVLVNSQGVAFFVSSAGKGMATIVTHDPKSESPKMFGIFHVLAKKKFNKENKK